MTTRRKIAGLCAGVALTLAFAPLALAAPAGDEYLPKIPQSGAHSSGGSAGGSEGGTTDTTTVPGGGTSSGSSSGSSSGAKQSTANQGDERDKKDKKDQKDKSQQVTPVGSTGSGDSDDGDSSGSILLNPIVLLMVAGVIAAAVAMTLRRRNVDEDEPESAGSTPSESDRGARSGPRTPDGEIVAGGDKA